MFRYYLNEKGADDIEEEGTSKKTIGKQLSNNDLTNSSSGW